MKEAFYPVVDVAARDQLADSFDSQLQTLVQLNLGKHLRERVDVQDGVQASWISDQ
ncbi:MAG: hypothetical protein KDB27_26700 [Planctomycetales bacterium]|nr:hypothetical protein [Planctomycetales bacterium]